MSSKLVVVVLLEHFESEVVMVGNVDLAVVKKEATVWRERKG
jgi:hypothetical protein